MGIFVASSIELIFKSRYTKPDASDFYASLCYFRAVMFQFFRTAFLWQWILSIIVVYLVVVRKTPVDKLRKGSHWYYGTLGLVSSLATILPIIFDQLGSNPRSGFCWINGSADWRVAIAYSHNAIGIMTFILLSGPGIQQLYRSSKVGNNPGEKVLKDLMYQHTIQNAFLFVTLSFAFLSAFNSILLQSWDGAWDSNYIASTTYTYCMATSYLLPSTGVVIAMIHSISYSNVKQFVAGIKKKLKRSEDDTVPLTSTVPVPVIEEYTMVQTPVSIPPQLEHQQSFLRAHAAYTTDLLLNVKEELAEMAESASDLTTTTGHEETEEDLNEKLSAAQQRWVENYASS